uniref:Ribosomal protein S20 n=1 Tax=Plumaria plumosa TaxID=189642 RepID=A0A4D6WW94_9FLOR|nr:ribosomal protein S20 [Plumaria plumosa]
MTKNSSASKRTQISLRNRSRNKSYKSAIKASIKKYLLSVINKQDLDSQDSSSSTSLSIAYQKIDKAVKRGIMHKNKAARKKARLAKMIK